MGGPTAGAGLLTQQKPGTWQHPELQAGAEKHGELIVRPATGLPHVGGAELLNIHPSIF